jgi:beta-glucosidase
VEFGARLAGTDAIAQTRGLQGEQQKGNWAYFNSSKVIALAKHYAAYGAALGGLNGAPAELSERTLREWYLRPWRAFAAAGGKGAMTSHNTVLNQPMHANDYVTNKIFRDEFGFGDGIIVSDCNDVPALVSFRVAANLSQAAAKGIKGGGLRYHLLLRCASSPNDVSLAAPPAMRFHSALTHIII